MNLEVKLVNKINILASPLNPGVYLFLDTQKKVIYVGKAKNLKNRLYSYLSINLHIKTAKLMEAAKYFSVVKVNTELESLLLEAELIKKYMPKYNIELKDDKYPLYIQITSGKYPILKTIRKVDIAGDSSNIFGPFPSSQNVKYVLRYLRKVVPFSDHLPLKKGCINSQIGLCNPCPSEIEREVEVSKKAEKLKIYKENIRIIKRILSGKTSSVIEDVRIKMFQSSKDSDFELASYYKNILDKLNYISQPITNVRNFVDNPNLLEDQRQAELENLKEYLVNILDVNARLTRIECFDVAHLMGENATASMVTFVGGIADKSLYRKFKIYQKNSGSDVDSLKEVANRRAKHLSDWGYPDLVIVDGGKPQLMVFKKVFDKVNIPTVGLAKRFETIVIKSNDGFVEVRPKGPALNLIQRIRDEAHRFARVYHHNLVTKTLLGK